MNDANKNQYKRKMILGQVFSGLVFTTAFGALTYSAVYADRNSLVVGVVSGIVMLAVLTIGYRYNKCMSVASSLENVTVLVRHNGLVVSGNIRITDVKILTKFMRTHKTMTQVNKGLLGFVRRQCMVALSMMSEEILQGDQLEYRCDSVFGSANRKLLHRCGVELRNAHVWTPDRECFKVFGSA